MLKYISLIFVFTVCISELRSDNGKRRFESMCNANQPIELDDSPSGEGGFTYTSSQGRDSWLISLNKNETDGIDITLSSFNLGKSFLVIREASAEILPSGKIQFISGKTSKNLKFFIPFSKSFYMEICPESDEGGSIAFTIDYERSVTFFGEDPLPTEHPTIEKVKQAVEIQFKGKTTTEFNNEIFILMFKTAVMSMARDYCLKAQIPFEETKSADEMVTIHNIRKCPSEWIETEICTSIHHSVFVSGGDAVERKIWEYQLTRNNLKEMWMSADEQYLKLIGLSIYKTPDTFLSIGGWLLTCLLPLLVVIGLIFLLRIIYRYIVEDLKGTSSVTKETTDFENRKKNKLVPNKYQQVPVFVKEDTTDASGSKDYGGTQGKKRSYRAALLVSRFKLKESIPE